MSDFPSSALSDFVLSDLAAVTTNDIDSDKLVGLRFSYFIKQQYDRARDNTSRGRPERPRDFFRPQL